MPSSFTKGFGSFMRKAHQDNNFNNAPKAMCEFQVSFQIVDLVKPGVQDKP